MGYLRAGQPWWAETGEEDPGWAADYLGRIEAGTDVGFPDLPLGPLPPRRDPMGYYRAGQDAASEYMIAEGQLRHQRGRMAMVPSGGEELASAHAVLGEGAYGPRRRRMNAMNVRAARRAIRRLTSFAHIARRIYAFTHPSKARGHFKMHRKRRR